MRTSTLLRTGAVITASALAFGLGTAPVSAAETSSAAAAAATAEPSTSAFGSASSVEAAGSISALRLASGVITSRATTQFLGTVAGSAPDNNVTTDVRINGVAKGRVQLYPGQGNGGVEIPRQWGSGKVQVGPTYFSDGTVDGNVSNVFYARKQVRSNETYPLKIRAVNRKLTFRAYGIKIVNPTTGKYQSVKRVKLQQYKGGKWKTKKTIKLNSSGNGKYKATIKKKYRYRLYVPRTSTQEQFRTASTGGKI